MSLERVVLLFMCAKRYLFLLLAATGMRTARLLVHRMGGITVSNEECTTANNMCRQC
jgi:hypothetical protein